MRIIDESLIPSGDAIYFKQGTWTHLQKAYKEALDALSKSLIGNNYSASTFYVLYGCVGTGTNPGARTISAGAIFYNGEIYLVPAASFTTTGSDVAVGTITVTSNYTDYSVDPQVTPNGNTVEVHKIRTIVFSAGASGSGDVNFTALEYDLLAKNYKDISSQITVNAAISLSHKEIRRYEDGTVAVSINGTFSGDISANTVLITGLPLGSQFGYSDVVIMQYGTTTPYIRHKGIFISFLGAGVINESIITLGSDNIISIEFIYKKA